MNILVTGSNGYIGQHVCRYFRKKGYRVTGVGRKRTSSDCVDDYIRCDFSCDNVEEILSPIFNDGVNTVLHIAADNRKEPYGIDVIRSNCIGTQALLELAEKYHTAAFIQLSSVPIIGNPKVTPINLNHPLEPPTIYHATKYLQELLADYAYRTTNLRTVSIRIPSPMGPGVNPRYIFPTFVRRAAGGENIILYGKGTRKQSYVHVYDICRVIDLFLASACHGTYLLGSPYLISNYELAQKCIDVLDSSSQIVFGTENDRCDGQIWEIDDSPLKKAIEYQPSITLEDMILEYRDYLQSTGEI